MTANDWTAICDKPHDIRLIVADMDGTLLDGDSSRVTALGPNVVGGVAIAKEQALADSAAVTIYRQYVDAYGLGFSQRREAEVTLPAYRGSLDIEARRIG